MKRLWGCDFCEANGENKTSMRRHEADCCCNPVNRTCATCRHNSVEWERAKPILRCAVENAHKRMEFQRDCAKWEAKQ